MMLNHTGIFLSDLLGNNPTTKLKLLSMESSLYDLGMVFLPTQHFQSFQASWTPSPYAASFYHEVARAACILAEGCVREAVWEEKGGAGPPIPYAFFWNLDFSLSWWCELSVLALATATVRRGPPT